MKVDLPFYDGDESKPRPDCYRYKVLGFLWTREHHKGPFKEDFGVGWEATDCLCCGGEVEFKGSDVF